VDWNIQECKRRSLSKAPEIGFGDKTKFYDENGVEITTALVLLNSFVPKEFNELPPTKKTHAFEKPTFIETLDPQVKAKINSIEVTISKTLETKEYQFIADFVGYILKNVLSGDVKTFPKKDK
jgi:uncharacterized protein (UPF0297 family)